MTAQPRWGRCDLEMTNGPKLNKACSWIRCVNASVALFVCTRAAASFRWSNFTSTQWQVLTVTAFFKSAHRPLFCSFRCIEVSPSHKYLSSSCLGFSLVAPFGSGKSKQAVQFNWKVMLWVNTCHHYSKRTCICRDSTHPFRRGCSSKIRKSAISYSVRSHNCKGSETSFDAHTSHSFINTL